jgi:hypothetical protein
MIKSCERVETACCKTTRQHTVNQTTVHSHQKAPIVLMTEPDINNMTAHNTTNTNSDNTTTSEPTTNISLTDMKDSENLYMEQQSLLYTVYDNDDDDYDDKSKVKPAKMLSSYRGRRRLAVLAVAVAIALGVVVVWGPLSSLSSSAEEGTSHRSLDPSSISHLASKKSFFCV